jgi:hypothetical protein
MTERDLCDMQGTGARYVRDAQVVSSTSRRDLHVPGGASWGMV